MPRRIATGAAAWPEAHMAAHSQSAPLWARRQHRPTQGPGGDRGGGGVMEYCQKCGHALDIIATRVCPNCGPGHGGRRDERRRRDRASQHHVASTEHTLTTQQQTLDNRPGRWYDDRKSWQTEIGALSFFGHAPSVGLHICYTAAVRRGRVSVARRAVCQDSEANAWGTASSAFPAKARALGDTAAKQAPKALPEPPRARRAFGRSASSIAQVGAA